MARDYKNRAQPKQVKPPTPGWVWLLVGLLMGAFAMGLVWLKLDLSGPPSAWVGARPDNPPPGTTKPAVAKPTADVPAVPAPKPRFDFYTMLPKMEVVVPDDELEPMPAGPAAAVAENGSYLVQIGSFRRTEDADRLKAQLALLGIETRVVTARISATDTRYRVRSGPYKGKAALDKARTQMASNGFQGIVIRAGGD